MYHTFCKSQPPILLIFSKILLKTILSPTFQITAFNNIIKSQRKATQRVIFKWLMFIQTVTPLFITDLR